MDSSDLERFFITHWQATVEQCEKSLEPDDLEQVRLITSWDLVQKGVLEVVKTNPSRSMPYEIALIEPTLGHLRQFASIFESQLSLQADFFWGIIGLLLKLTAQAPQALSRIPRMLKSLGYKAEAFKRYYAVSLENADDVKEAYFDIQIQLVGFFTRAVACMRGEKHETKYNRLDEEEDPWLLLQRRFTATNQELTETLARVEKIAAIRPSGCDHQRFSDIAALTQRFRCMVMPTKKTPRFFDRVDAFEKIDLALGGEASSTSFRAVALFGLGGIGKSSIAARYLERKFEDNEYDAVFWIHGEKTASLRQSFTDIALRLRLDGAKPNLHDDNLILVQNWLQLTECKWLVVYDNVESADILMPYWPEASHGKAIITTRNHSLAYEPATSGLEITSWDEKTGSEFLLFLLKRNIGSDIQVEGESAAELSKKLSGHALAISHMAGLIHRRSWSIAEFASIYSKNPRRAHETELQAVWDFSFSTLGKDSRTFLGIASFLVPEHIPQLLFEFEEDGDIPEDLKFCADEFSFSEAIEPLLTLAVIKRDRDDGDFSCHRMVQISFRYFLSRDERQKALITLLRYLYEVHALKDLEDVCEVNLMAVETLDNQELAHDIAAWTLSHQASMYESTGNVQKAIELNRKGYEMRLAERPLKGGLVGGFEQNLAYNYNTANEHEMALTWFEKSRETWIAENSKQGRGRDWPAVTKTNMARCLVYLGQYDKAQELLDISITEFKQEKSLNWAMLAYAYFVQGTLERKRNSPEAAEASFIEAQNLWMRGDQTRLHPFHAACLYKIGVVCLEQGKVEAAVKHLRDSLEATKFHSSVMPAEHARGKFKLSEVLLQDTYDDSDEVSRLRDEAEVYLLRRDPEAVEFGRELDYDVRVPIFWR